MQLLNKQTLYRCIKTGNKLKINGAFTVSDDKKIQLSGNFNTLESEYCGDFNYCELNNGKVTISISNMVIDLIPDASQFLIETVNEFKNQININ